MKYDRIIFWSIYNQTCALKLARGVDLFAVYSWANWPNISSTNVMWGINGPI
jgi:hypothetical protein